MSRPCRKEASALAVRGRQLSVTADRAIRDNSSVSWTVRADASSQVPHSIIDSSASILNRPTHGLYGVYQIGAV